MPAPLLIGIGIGTGTVLAEGAFHPMRSFIGAQFQPWDQVFKYKAWHDRPILIPEPGMLYQLYVREMVNKDWLQWGLRYHGINPGTYTEGKYAQRRVTMWDGVRRLHQSVPSPDAYTALAAREWITPEQRRDAIVRAGGDPDLWLDVERLHLTRPRPEEVWDAHVRGMVDEEEARYRITSYGGDWNDFANVRPMYRAMPTIGEAMEGYRRGIVSDELWASILKYHRVDDIALLDLWEELRRGIPGISDLLRMGSRLLFTPELAGKYGLYDGFQEASRPYFKQLGLDYSLGFNIPVDGVQREATLPDLYWGATREILPLGIAYAAYQRLRPAQIPRYRDEVPNLRDFSIEDLRLHMRVAGYPPPMQDYLIALSHPPLGRRDIPQVMQHTGRDADWAYSQYLNLGLRSEDARIVADTQYARVHAHDTAWIKSLRDGARKATAKETEGLYDEGIIDRGAALQQLSVAGLPDDLSEQLLNLSDARRARGLLRAAVTATGRDYLSGALSAADALSALSTYGIHRERAGELMQIWTIRRSRRRRQADTSRIIRWVGEGRIDVSDALRRLDNLGWTNPDILLLVGEGEAKLAALRAKAEASEEKATANRAKELERLSRETDAEAKRQRAEANRVAPRSSLVRWVTDGVIDRETFYSLMRDRGYPEEDIDRYYQDATTPRPPRPKVLPAEAARPKPAGSAHPTATVLKRWATEKIIDRVQFREGLSTLGFSAEDIQRFEEEQYGQPTNGQPTAQP